MLESHDQDNSTTLYPHVTLPSVSFVGALGDSTHCPSFSKRRRPLRSKKTMSCQPSHPTPPPCPNSGSKNCCVVAMKFPDGHQASGCSKPGVVSTVDCSTTSLLQ